MDNSCLARERSHSSEPKTIMHRAQLEHLKLHLHIVLCFQCNVLTFSNGLPDLRWSADNINFQHRPPHKSIRFDLKFIFYALLMANWNRYPMHTISLLVTLIRIVSSLSFCTCPIVLSYSLGNHCIPFHLNNHFIG